MRAKNLDITLDLQVRLPEDIDINSVLSSTKIAINDITISLGEEVNIDDPRFTEENASIGLWMPHHFLKKIGAGIYFLDPFDPNKIPVLFVHGVSGNPSQWAQFAGSDCLDLSKFQRWICYYPSGLNLSIISQRVSRRLTDLQEEYNFSELVIVAHSMGGLVSRDVINNLVELESPIQIPLFLTLSTPWEGHEAAELGVKYSPVIVPCWIDMVPGSDFLTKLWETPLPDETEHALFFSYHGKNSSIIDRNNDGIVTVSSQLSLEPQKNAVMVRGFNVNHTGILKDPQVIDCFKTLVSEKLNNFHQYTQEPNNIKIA